MRELRAHEEDVNTPALTPIETEYQGVKFRSRLEARWAVFFDRLGVKWLYEPEGFELPSGRYLPDFYLPLIGTSDGPTCSIGTWIEIKPDSYKDVDERFSELPTASDHRLILLKGPPCSDFDELQSRQAIECFLPGGGWYGFYMPCICLECGKFGFEFDGRGGRICGHGPEKTYNPDHPRIEAAAKAANAYRFW